MEKQMLKDIMKEKGVSQRKMAENLGVNEKTLRSRIEGATEFTLEEITAVSEMLSLDENQIGIIFFEGKVS